MRERERRKKGGLEACLCLALIDNISFSVWLAHKDSKALPSSFSHLASVVIVQSCVLYMAGLSLCVCISECVRVCLGVIVGC